MNVKFSLKIFSTGLTPMRKKITTDAGPETILSLIERFEFHRQAYILGNYNETQLRREFVDKFSTAIDKLMYELYGLTGEEIAIVEGNAK